MRIHSRSLAFLLIAVSLVGAVSAQNPLTEKTGSEVGEQQKSPVSPDKIDVQPEARDKDIANRLQRILDATGWFVDVQVNVEEGVAFLQGTAEEEEMKTWAGDLARRTQDVVAVVNHMEVAKPPATDFRPAIEGLNQLWRDSIGAIPFVIFGLVILAISLLAAQITVSGSRRALRRRVSAALLREVLARAAGFIVLILGLYIVLKVSGLTRLALTVVGGTGIIGLIIGIAFRDITENFLASIFLSMQRPFLVGDLVQIVDVLGYVQQLTVRTTVLMTLNGNQVAIPNSTVYKNTIRNFSSNKNRREDFTIGVAYDAPIPHAQEVALKVLREHPAILKDPEPWALVDSLGSASVVLRIYFWLDGSEHSWLKVRSSVIRLIKRAFQDAGIGIPDEAREVVFPKGVPVRMVPEAEVELSNEAALEAKAAQRETTELSEPVATRAEGGLNSEATEIKDQARQSRQIEGDNLLDRGNDGA